MSELMSEAINLMLVGMGFVFIFLIILVVTTSMMSKLVARFYPKVPEPVVVNTHSDITEIVPDDLHLLAVITAALVKYRSQHNK